jgi:hypothetical protein
MFRRRSTSLRGWTFNGVYRVQSGIPFQISSKNCNVPSQFINFCSPALLPGRSPFLQSPSGFDPSNPVLNVNSFEPAAGFTFYTGRGPRAVILTSVCKSRFKSPSVLGSNCVETHLTFSMRTTLTTLGPLFSQAGRGAVHSTPMSQAQTLENGMEA